MENNTQPENESLPSKPFVRLMPDVATRDRYHGCLIGGAVGDALGAPVEFLRHGEILRQFGPAGIIDMAPVYGRIGAITDDTQMALFTAEGMLRSYVRGSTRGICNPAGVIAYAYQRWLHTQGEVHASHKHCLNGWLVSNQALHAQRAPGLTCLSALRETVSTGQPALNDSKGCGGVMRVAPVGMMFQSLSASYPAGRDENFQRSFDLACEAAGLTHGHVTGQLASGAFSALVFLVLEGKGLPDAVAIVLEVLGKHAGHDETSSAIRHAVQLSVDQPNSHLAIKALGGGWIAEEALAIGLYSALCTHDFESGVIMAVNHDGDSDSTGLIAGHLLGAIHGLSAIPDRWLAPLELRNVLEEVADDLATVGRWRLDDWSSPEACAEENYYTARYPGG